MQLIYTGIINENSVQNFVFSDKYNISYDIDTKSINIERRETNIPKGFFGKTVDTVNLVVGENGVGKTTLLESIGFSSNIDNNKINFINLYEYKDDNQNNQFVIEGSNKDLLAISNIFGGLSSTKNSFCYNASYDFSSHSFKNTRFSKNEDPHIKGFQIVSEDSNYRPNSDFIQRRIIGSYNEKDEFDFLLADSKSNNFFDKENIYPMEFVLEIFPVVKNYQHEINALKSLLGKNVDILNKFKNLYSNFNIDITNFIESNNASYKKMSNKEYFILRLKFSLIITICRKVVDAIELNTIQRKLPNTIELVNTTDFDDAFDKIINKLFLILKDIEWMKSVDENMVYDLINSIKELPEDSFSSASAISFQISEEHLKEKNKLIEVIALLRTNSSQNGVLNFLKSNIKNISSGQKQLIEIMSRVYAMIAHFKREASEHKQILFLLDEPDLYLHPEWSRKLVNTLISTINLYSNVHVSIIITTHSPFLLSDIPGDFILKMSSYNGQHVVSRSEGGYGKNIYDILHDSFFLNMFIGEFAKSKIDNILEKIKLAGLDNTVPRWIEDKEVNDSIEKEIELIGDPVLKSQLGAMKLEAEKNYILLSGKSERQERFDKLVQLYEKE